MDDLRRSKIPKCARGLPILLVDHDTTSLMYLASMLEQYSYKVTTTELTSVAMSMIRERNEGFKLVMANINMDDMNHLSFLDILIKKDIPVVLVSSQRSQNVAQKAIAYGACLHLEKPISLNDLKYLWQHVYQNNDSKTKRSYDDEEEKRNDKRSKSNIKPTVSERRETAEERGKEKKNNQSSSSRGRKSRFVWSQELHHKFTAAVTALGDKNARPKIILKMMNEPTLTHRQVASHLQKYKAQVQRISTASTSTLPSVTNESTTTYGKPGSFYMPQKNKPVLSHLGHQSSNFLIGANNCQFPNLPQDSIAPISSLYQNQQVPNVPQDIHQNLHVTLDSTDSLSSLNQTHEFPSMLCMNQKLDFIPESTVTDISLNQSQVFVSSTQTTKQVDFVAAEYTAMPNADNSLTGIIGQNPNVDPTTHAVTSTILSENQNQQSAVLVDLLKVLNEECSGIEPNPGEVDQYCEWLNEAMFGNNEEP